MEYFKIYDIKDRHQKVTDLQLRSTVLHNIPLSTLIFPLMFEHDFFQEISDF